MDGWMRKREGQKEGQKDRRRSEGKQELHSGMQQHWPDAITTPVSSFLPSLDHYYYADSREWRRGAAGGGLQLVG